MNKKLVALSCLVLSVNCMISNVHAYSKANCNRIELNEGSKVNLAVKLKVKKKNTKWKSANKSVATVNKKGVVKGIKKGKTKIRMTIGRKKTWINVVVKKVKRNSVSTSAKVSSTPDGNTSMPTTPTATPTIPTATPTVTPEDIREMSGYIADIKDYNGIRSFYIADNKCIDVTSVFNSNNIKGDNITYNSNKIAYDNLEVGDYVKITISGPLALSMPARIMNVHSIVVLEKNPDMKGKVYSYTVTALGDDEYTIVDECGTVYTKRYYDKNGAVEHHYFLNDTEVNYSELKVGDILNLYYDEDIQASPSDSYSYRYNKIVIKR